jgi:hypothetical protein
MSIFIMCGAFRGRGGERPRDLALYVTKTRDRGAHRDAA